MTKKPLHVQVAEALGTVDSKEVPPFYYVTPKYDTDWEDAGPLIERYFIEVGPSYDGLGLKYPEQRWTAAFGTDRERDGEEFRRGPTPLIAVCNLILALHAAGKLKPLQSA